MKKNKLLILSVAVILILAVVAIGETVYVFKLKAKEEAQKTPAAMEQNLSKGIKNVYVQVRIKEETKDGQFTDTLYYTLEEWSKKSAEDIQKAIQTRVDNWLKVTGTPEGR